MGTSNGKVAAETAGTSFFGTSATESEGDATDKMGLEGAKDGETMGELGVAERGPLPISCGTATAKAASSDILGSCTHQHAGVPGTCTPQHLKNH